MSIPCRQLDAGVSGKRLTSGKAKPFKEQVRIRRHVLLKDVKISHPLSTLSKRKVPLTAVTVDPRLKLPSATCLLKIFLPPQFRECLYYSVGHIQLVHLSRLIVFYASAVVQSTVVKC